MNRSKMVRLGRTLVVFAVCSWGILPALRAADRQALRSGRPEIIAHRGASYDAPENSLSSVRLAWARDADAVEIDIYLARDKQIVVYHDKTTERIGGRNKAVWEQTLAELRQLDIGAWKGAQFAGERIPTLQQVLHTVPRGKRLFIEVKAGVEIVPHLVRSIRDWKQAETSAVVIAFSIDVCKAVKKELPQVPVYWLIGFKQDKKSGEWSPLLADVLRQAKACGFEGLDVNDTRLLDQDFVESVHGAGLELYVWTVNDPRRAGRLAAFGVDGITTDRPAWLKRNMLK